MDTLNLLLGESTSIGLTSLAMAGYTWRYRVNISNKVTINKESTDKNLVALNVHQSKFDVFSIKAIAKGTVQVVFYQQKDSEQNASPRGSKVFLININ